MSTTWFAWYEPDTGRIRNLARTKPELLARDAEGRDASLQVLIVGDEAGDARTFIDSYKVVDGEFVPVED